jgi:hypothetical protein
LEFVTILPLWSIKGLDVAEAGLTAAAMTDLAAGAAVRVAYARPSPDEGLFTDI